MSNLLDAARQALPGLDWLDNRGVLSARVLYGKWLKAQPYDGKTKVATWLSGWSCKEERRKHESAEVAAASMREQVTAMRDALDAALGEPKHLGTSAVEWAGMHGIAARRADAATLAVKMWQEVTGFWDPEALRRYLKGRTVQAEVESIGIDQRAATVRAEAADAKLAAIQAKIPQSYNGNLDAIFDHAAAYHGLGVAMLYAQTWEDGDDLSYEEQLELLIKQRDEAAEKLKTLAGLVERWPSTWHAYECAGMFYDAEWHGCDCGANAARAEARRLCGVGNG